MLLTRFSILRAVWIAALFILGLGIQQRACAGHAAHEDLLLGWHFNFERTGPPTSPPDTTLSLSELAKYRPDDMARISYADWWITWNMAERYKGDQQGMELIDSTVNNALDLGVKVKFVLIFSSNWTNDIDWATTTTMGGAPNAAEYASWCGRFADHLRGRVATIDLQGEANSGDYWRPVPNLKDPMQHIAQVYIDGAKAIRKADPAVLIGVADVTPGLGGINQLGEPISKENIMEWYRYHLKAAAGTYDVAMINYFADIAWADPFGSGWEYYKFVRETLDELGQHDVEIGSGESSVEYAEDSWTLDTLSERQQAWRLNETLGRTYTHGMTKWMWHGLPQPPGAGWVWRWGWSKYEDHWGIWPENTKIPGTQIVYAGNDKKKGPADLRPAWNNPADTRLPVSSIFEFWSQAFPGRSSAVKLPIEVEKQGGSDVYKLGSFLRTKNEAVALVYTTDTQSISVTLDVARTGWNEGTALRAAWINETIDLTTGKRTVHEQNEREATVKQGKIALQVPKGNNWTTIRLRPTQNSAEVIATGWPGEGEAGAPLAGSVTVRNAGSADWPGDGKITVREYDDRAPQRLTVALGELTEGVKAGAIGSIALQTEAANVPQRQRLRARLYHEGKDPSGWFGPVIELFTDVRNSRAPREFIALREVGHTRLSWFAPALGAPEHGYEILRAEGIDGEERAVAKVTATEYIDKDVKPDVEYYYRVRALGAHADDSAVSRRDNARGISAARIWDAEITGYQVPGKVKRADPTQINVTVKNTGRSAWKAADAAISLRGTQLWGERNIAALPRLGLSKDVAPGESITFELPYVAPTEGEFQNHWVMHIDTPKVGSAWFGSPLRVMTTVGE